MLKTRHERRTVMDRDQDKLLTLGSSEAVPRHTGLSVPPVTIAA